MNQNSVLKNMMQFAPQEITFAEFEYKLINETNPNNRMKIGWITELGLNRFYEFYWLDGPIGDGIAGGSDTKALVDMYNLRVVGEDGDWRTVDFRTVYKIRFENKSYKVIN